MLDPQVDAVRAMTDATAERIATLGVSPVGTPGALVAARTWDDYDLGRATAIEHLGALDVVYTGVIEGHRKAIDAIQSGRFRNEISPVAVPQRQGDALIMDTDESPRKDSTLEKLSSLKPAFKKDGTVTAGNAPGVNDGAAALVVTSATRATQMGLTPIARIVGQAVSGIEPMLLLMAPVKAVHKLLEKVGWKMSDIDLVELNEAFSVQAIAVMEELKLDPAKVNVNGGAVALGHPIGASGARILVTLLHEMIRRNAKRGVATLCLGGGNAVAMAVER